MWILLIALQAGNGLTQSGVEFNTEQSCNNAKQLFLAAIDDKLGSNAALVCVPKGENK